MGSRRFLRRVLTGGLVLWGGAMGSVAMAGARGTTLARDRLIAVKE